MGKIDSVGSSVTVPQIQTEKDGTYSVFVSYSSGSLWLVVIKDRRGLGAPTTNGTGSQARTKDDFQCFTETDIGNPTAAFGSQ